MFTPEELQYIGFLLLLRHDKDIDRIDALRENRFCREELISEIESDLVRVKSLLDRVRAINPGPKDL